MGMTSFIISLFLVVALKNPLLTGFKFPQWLFANAELVPLLPALVIVGGIIVVTLSYVSWRKYKGEKEKGKKEQKRDKSVD